MTTPTPPDHEAPSPIYSAAWHLLGILKSLEGEKHARVLRRSTLDDPVDVRHISLLARPELVPFVKSEEDRIIWARFITWASILGPELFSQRKLGAALRRIPDVKHVDLYEWIELDPQSARFDALTTRFVHRLNARGLGCDPFPLLALRRHDPQGEEATYVRAAIVRDFSRQES